MIEALLRKVFRTGVRRGLSGGHWAWFLIAGAAFVLRRARRPDGRSTTTIELGPEDRYLVTVAAPGDARRDRAE